MADSNDGLTPSVNTQAQCATKPLDNPLWQYACQFYSQPGVEAALLELQDEHGADINLILQALWLASLGKEWSSDCVPEAYPLWMAQQIQPLRKMRREMKQAWPEQEGFRQQVKKLELKAEQVALAMLFMATEDNYNRGQEGETSLFCRNLEKVGQGMNILPAHFQTLLSLRN